MYPGGEVIGVGIDAVDVERFRRVLGRRPRFAERVFTAAERAEAAGRRDPVPGLAARFAAKEAVMKSLSVGLGAFDFADVLIETVDDVMARDLVLRRAFSTRFNEALGEPPEPLGLDTAIQKATWRCIVALAPDIDR